jgi:hypothetical protein
MGLLDNTRIHPECYDDNDWCVAFRLRRVDEGGGGCPPCVRTDGWLMCLCLVMRPAAGRTRSAATRSRTSRATPTRTSW